MCGIAGIVTRDGGRPADSVLDALGGALGHRGPDGVGRYFLGDTALIQTRLAIIDLETGDQPLFIDQGKDRPPLALVANGEIYNFVELKRRITGVVFKTRSDCEPPLFLYDKHRIEFAEHLRGMYTIAIHDPGRGQLVLARDPFGIKPLYYGLTEDGFVFASEIQALLAAGLTSPQVAEGKGDELLQLQFTTGAETPIEGVYRVFPGETLVIEKGEISERIRLGALPPAGPRPISESAALEDFDAVFQDAVDVHQRSDVPYGMFLSGGIDSSAVLAMMARLNDEPVRAFTAGFSGTAARDEREHAKAVAKAVGTEHREVDFSETDFWSLLPTVAATLDDPCADYAVLPTYKLAAEAHRTGLKVVLSGEGGDEIFGGYGRYRRALRPWFLGGQMPRRDGALAGLGLLRRDDGRWRGGLAEVERSLPDELTRLQKVQAMDCADWLPNDLLTKLDRCLMAHGVEGRVPFLDPKLADFAFRLPDRLKVKKNLGKWLLRKWLDKNLPVADAFSGKRGFTVPVGEWMAVRAAQLAPLMARQPGIREVCHPEAVDGLFRTLDGCDKKKAQAAWLLLFYSLWHNAHVLGRDSSGDVFACLTET